MKPSAPRYTCGKCDFDLCPSCAKPPAPSDDAAAASGGSPSTAPACGPCAGAALVGKSIEVYWPLDSAWYVANVVKYRPATGKHSLVYVDDQVREVVKLGDEKWSKMGMSKTMDDSELDEGEVRGRD